MTLSHQQTMDAFHIFLLNWKIPENTILREKARVQNRQKAKSVCCRVLKNRELISSFRFLVWSFHEMKRTGEDWSDPIFFKSILRYIQVSGSEITRQNPVFGICEFCQKGLVRFNSVSNKFAFSADCVECGRNHLAWKCPDFEENETI